MTSVKTGMRLRSVVCATEVVVVSGGAIDVDLRCGGEPMAGLEERASTAAHPLAGLDTGTAIGKRYVDKAGLEVLCTKAGQGTLTVGDEVLSLKAAKPLPSSD